MRLEDMVHDRLSKEEICQPVPDRQVYKQTRRRTYNVHVHGTAGGHPPLDKGGIVEVDIEEQLLTFMVAIERSAG